MTHGFRQGARAYAWHLGLVMLVIGLLWAGIGFSLWHDRRLAEQTAEHDTANLARAFSPFAVRVCFASGFLMACASSRIARRHEVSGIQGIRNKEP